MDDNKSHKPRYMTINDVILKFSEKLNPIKSNTLYMHIRRKSIDWNHSVLAMVVYVDETKAVTILPEVVLMIWETPDVMSKIRAAEATGGEVNLTSDFRFVTQFSTEDHFFGILSVFGPIDAAHVYEKLNEFTWMQSVNSRPMWYSNEEHREIFDPHNEFTLVDYDHFEAGRVFSSAGFQRALKADQLLEELDNIPSGDKGADLFHDWVILALQTIFPDDLERVRKHPNGSATERRDIVATNVKNGRFWKRLYSDYRVSMPIFEVKNYSPPAASDFQQVSAYLGHEHYGKAGFIVTRSDSLTLQDLKLSQFREMYRKNLIGNLIIPVPSVLLSELLLAIRVGNSGHENRKMEEWMEEFLLKHLYE